ncbi:GNAT family N-acetyltransferase [Staphylococcus edaphicus]|uniref:GCN5-related N-acetyltransferase n=1 Tax=Staphylococcus edaphicus TaxID=1955013 RepID=A0A2C6WN77_9STAP|nr:GNAT family N-acetyltransferase [Staphylococcus edaphicus]PHK49809.1 GNAT family N-acetyltransferase [Staphylococcus edaphicus]UQW80785.1 GNAT family N-acetyltransferase [Staphylococcus edaphicus]
MFNIVNTPTMMEDALQIRKDVFVKEQGVPLENEIDQYEEIATHVIGYDSNHIPFATGRFRPINDGVKIERVAIMPSHRKSGNGQLLMQFLENVAKQQGFHKLSLNAQCHAQRFYESLGYKAIGDTFIEENIEHIAMTKIV